MARLQKQAKKTARLTAKAEFAPQIQSKRRGLHHEVAALESEEDPLNSGLESAEKTVRHSPLTGADKAELLSQFATEQAGVPAGIASQVNSAREVGHGEISDLQTQEAQSRAALLSSLLTKAAEHSQSVQDEINAEGRSTATTLALAQQEKDLGLGAYDQTPSPEEAAEIPKIEAETAEKEKGGGLTPYQQLEHQEKTAGEHNQAATTAKALLYNAKEEGKVPPDPKEWDEETWNHLVVATANKGKVALPVAEKAVGAIRNHFEPPHGLPGVFGAAAKAAVGALAGSAPQAATPGGAPASLLSLVAPLHSGRY